MDTHRKQPQHFLIATYSIQSHINPALNLAKRLVSINSDVMVTFSTSMSGHRRMFPNDKSLSVEQGKITFIPYPDGAWNRADTTDVTQYEPAVGFSSIISNLAANGRHVSCVIPTLLLNWAADVAREHGIPCVQYWIQPATTFAAYYYFFHGYENLIASHVNDPAFEVKLPGLPSMQIRDLPSFLTTDMSGGPFAMILPRFRENFDRLDVDIATNYKSKPKILVNSFDELESSAFTSVENVDLIGIGPILPCLAKVDDTKFELDMFEDDKKGYMDWLDEKTEKSVVFVSFGSISVMKKELMEEIYKGLKASKRPYLWVVRKDCKYEGFEIEDDENAMVVEWCSQVRVLSHPSVGCFVTHCGWNSTFESLVCGVPTVGVPQWSDQQTNAMLVEKLWKCGVRAEIDETGVLNGGELERCLDLVMGNGEKGEDIRKYVGYWKQSARDAIVEGGSSDQNLRAFVEEIDIHVHCC